MSKHVRFDGIVAGSQQPFTKTTHQWYNDMVSESALAAISGLIPVSYLTGKLIILSGCALSGTNPGIRNITSGWVFYNGETFKVDAGTFTTTGPEIGVWSIVETNLPLEFSDGVNKSVHQEKKFQITNGASGSGLFDEDSIDVIRAFETINDIPTQSGSPTSTLSIIFFELKKHGSLVSLSIAGSISVSSGDAAILNTGAGYIQWTLTLPQNCVPERTVIGGGAAFANVSANPYKAAQVYSERISDTTISLRLTATQTVASGDSFSFTLGASYLIGS
jgi:hypothetical protein